MVSALELYYGMKNDELAHYGTPGMHWRQQGPGKRYQSQAVYAQGRPNPNAKVRGQKEGSIRLPGFRRGLSSDELQREIDKKSTSELKEATNRLIAEKDYKNAVINNMKATRDYNSLMNEGSVNVGKKFMKGLKYFTKSDLGKLAWTAAKYKGYEMMREKHGDEAARTIFGSVLKFNDGKKNPNGNPQQDQDKDAQQQNQGKNKKKQQKNQNGGN